MRKNNLFFSKTKKAFKIVVWSIASRNLSAKNLDQLKKAYTSSLTLTSPDDWGRMYISVSLVFVNSGCAKIKREGGSDNNVRDFWVFSDFKDFFDYRFESFFSFKRVLRIFEIFMIRREGRLPSTFLPKKKILSFEIIHKVCKNKSKSKTNLIFNFICTQTFPQNKYRQLYFVKSVFLVSPHRLLYTTLSCW